MLGNTKIIPIFASHHFIEVSFIKPKKCDYCKGLVIKKGNECSDCGIIVHRAKCFDRAKLLLCGGSSVTVAEVPQNDSMAVTVENCIPEVQTPEILEPFDLPPETELNSSSEIKNETPTSSQPQIFTTDSVLEQLTDKEIALKDKLKTTQSIVHQLEQTREHLFEDVFKLRNVISTLQEMGYTV